MLFNDQARYAVEQSYMRGEIERGMQEAADLGRMMEGMWQAGESRRGDCKAFRKMYDNDWEVELKRAIKKRFREENYNRLMLVLDTSINVLRWVVNRVGGIYKKPATRTLRSNGVEILNERFNAYQLEAKLNATMLQANRMSVLYQDILVGPCVATHDDGTKRLRYRFLTPDCCEVLVQHDDPTAIKAIFYPFTGSLPNGQPALRYAYWDRHHYRVFDGMFKELPVVGPDGKENEDKVNPYGRVPFVVFRPEHAVDRFWHWQKTKGLYNTTINGGVGFTDILHAIKNQSFKQLALAGDDLDQIDPLSLLDPSQVLDLGSGGEASVLDLQANIPQLFETIMSLLAFAVHTYGIMPKAFRGQLDAQSGYALEIQERDLKEVHAEQREAFRPAEQLLYDVTVAVNNAHFEDELPKGDLHVDYEEAGPGQDPQTVATYWTGLVNNDPPLAGPIQAIMNIHAVDREQAEEMFAEAIEQKKMAQQALSPLPMAPMFPSEPPAPEPDPELPPPEDPGPEIMPPGGDA